MHLYFIRHAQSTNNALYARGSEAYAAVRTHDPELTEVGRRQAETLAEFLATHRRALDAPEWDPQNRHGFAFTHLYTSLMVRAVSTGTILAARLGLPLHAWVDWHEEGGLFLDTDEPGVRLPQPGYGRAYFTSEYPALVLPETLGDDGWWGGGFEEHPQRPARARRVLAELLARHGATDDQVVVVSHGGFYTHFVAAVLGLQPPYPLSFMLNNAAIARIAFTAQAKFVLYQNRCDYLPDELVSA
jgi:2,3-bisphosphoglycerate-dependent phosphoglycerate mutase